MKVLHFNSQEERLAYLKGGLQEILPKKAQDAEPVDKPKKKASKSKKKSKKEDK